MASKAELALILSLVDDVSKTAKEVKGELESVGKQGMSAQKVVSDLGNIGFGILKAGAVIGAAAVTAVGAALTSIIKDEMSYQTVAAQTAAVIESTGGAAGYTTEEVLAMADSLQRVTRFSDEAVLEAQNLLLTFTGIGKEVFPDATMALLDMATAMGTDASGAAIQLGKALNDPTTGITALTRVGVVFTDEQKNLIKSLQESGDLAGAQTVILKELQKEFGGSAVAAGKTFAGQLDILKNSFDAIMGDIAVKLIPILEQLSAALMDTLAKPEVKASIDAIVAAIGTFALKMGNVVSLLLQGDVSGALTAMFGADMAAKIIEVTTAISGFVTSVGEFVTKHSEAFKGALIAIGAILGGAMIATAISGIVTAIAALASPVGIIIAAVGLLGAAWAGNWGGIQEKTQAVIDWLVPIVNGAITAITEWWAANGAMIIGTVTATWEWIKAQFQAAVDFIKPIVENALSAISAWWDIWGGEVTGAVENIWNFIVAAFTKYFEIVRQVVETVWGAIQQIWETYGAQIMAVITNVWEIIKTIFSTAFTFIKTLFEGFVMLFNGDLEGFAMKVTEAFTVLWEGVVKIVTLAWDNLKLVGAVAMDAIGLALDAAWEWIKGIFVSAWAAIVTGVTDAWSSFQVAITTLVDNVIAFFTDTNWAKVGTNIIGGIVKGVDDAAQWLWDTVTNLLSGLLDKVKEFFGIASPSKLMASVVGEPLIQGIGVGMTKAMKMLENTQLPDMTARIVDGTAGSVGVGQSRYGVGGQPVQAGNTYNQNLTIVTASRDEDIIADFSLMTAMAGV